MSAEESFMHRIEPACERDYVSGKLKGRRGGTSKPTLLYRMPPYEGV